MRGLRFEDLAAVVDFLYLGEANVNQDRLDNFLALAEELKLKGLTGRNESDENDGSAKKKSMQLYAPYIGNRYKMSRNKTRLDENDERKEKQRPKM